MFTTSSTTLSLPLLCRLQVPKGDGHTAITLTADIKPETPFPSTADIRGIRPIFLRFRGEEGQDLFQIDWFRFDPSDS